MRRPRWFARGSVTIGVGVCATVCGCGSPRSDGDRAAIDEVTRAYDGALVRYDCAALREVATDGHAACAQIIPEDERTPMPTPVEFGPITVENGQTVRKLTGSGEPCVLVVEKRGEVWLVKTPPGLVCS